MQTRRGKNVSGSAPKDNNSNSKEDFSLVAARSRQGQWRMQAALMHGAEQCADRDREACTAHFLPACDSQFDYKC